MSYRIVNGKIFPLGDFSGLNPVKSETTKNSKATVSFQESLNKAIKKDESFIVSNHAAQRLKTRNISFNEKDMLNINQAINSAGEKGANDCLILYKDVALVASIKNRTIITAVDKESSKGNVFTNVDSVVLL